MLCLGILVQLFDSHLALANNMSDRGPSGQFKNLIVSIHPDKLWYYISQGEFLVLNCFLTPFNIQNGRSPIPTTLTPARGL